MLGWSGIATLPPWDPALSLDDILSSDVGDGLDHPLRRHFHHDSEPEELIRLDMTRRGAMGAPQPWGAMQIPGGPAIGDPRWPLNPGVVAEEAAAIDVPVFIAAGEIDVIGDPWAEPGAYRGSPDVTVAVFENMAHMHNFAPTRRHLWRRLAGWAEAVAARQEVERP
jgi:pimeloyl-ACP methyl ester carboxylesterase